VRWCGFDEQLHVLIVSTCYVILSPPPALTVEPSLADIMWICFLLAAGSWLFFGKCTLAALVNVTIDDTFGDPKTGAQVTYSPDGWNNGTNCSGCTAHPDVSHVYLATVSHMYGKGVSWN
jgi:hypothetical protein